jgi:signal transduction histidine kinase
MESHRGSIWAENNPDRGATFRFTLPLVDQAAAAKGSASA